MQVCDPLQSTHVALRRPWTQKELPPHSRHCALSRPCSHTDPPPHSRHVLRRRLCGHTPFRAGAPPLPLTSLVWPTLFMVVLPPPLLPTACSALRTHRVTGDAVRMPADRNLLKTRIVVNISGNWRYAFSRTEELVVTKPSELQKDNTMKL